MRYLDLDLGSASIETHLVFLLSCLPFHAHTMSSESGGGLFGNTSVGAGFGGGSGGAFGGGDDGGLFDDGEAGRFEERE